MIRFLSTFLTLLLGAAATAQEIAPGESPEPAGVVFFGGGASLPANRWLATAFNVGPASRFVPGGSDVRALTGLASSPGQNDLAAPAVAYGLSAGGTTIQIAGGGLGIWYDSASTPPASGTVVPFNLQKIFQPALAPWSKSGESLAIGADIAVPVAQVEGHAVPYVTTIIEVVEGKLGRPFWITVQLYDARGFDRPKLAGWDLAQKEFTAWDGGTGQPIVATALRGDSLVVRADSGSASATGAVWPNYAPYRFTLGRSGLAAVIKRLRAFGASNSMAGAYANASTDPADYSVTLAGFELESYVEAGSRVQVGASFRNAAAAVRELGATATSQGTLCLRQHNVVWECGDTPVGSGWSASGTPHCVSRDSGSLCAIPHGAWCRSGRSIEWQCVVQPAGKGWTAAARQCWTRLAATGCAG